MLAATRASGSGLAHATGGAPDSAAIRNLYACSQNHLAAYGDSLSKGSLKTPLDRDAAGLQQMINNTSFPEPKKKHSSNFFKKLEKECKRSFKKTGKQIKHLMNTRTIGISINNDGNVSPTMGRR